MKGRLVILLLNMKYLCTTLVVVVIVSVISLGEEKNSLIILKCRHRWVTNQIWTRKSNKKTCGCLVAEERSRHVETIGKLRLSLSFF